MRKYLNAAQIRQAFGTPRIEVVLLLVNKNHVPRVMSILSGLGAQHGYLKMKRDSQNIVGVAINRNREIWHIYPQDVKANQNSIIIDLEKI